MLNYKGIQGFIGSFTNVYFGAILWLLIRGSLVQVQQGEQNQSEFEGGSVNLLTLNLTLTLIKAGNLISAFLLQQLEDSCIFRQWGEQNQSESEIGCGKFSYTDFTSHSNSHTN